MTGGAPDRIPFVVIGGFLGAGKTTLLNRWLDEARGARLALLVNDFGALAIDAGLIEARDGDTLIALRNGCICCTTGDDLTGALLSVLALQPRVDAVVVEASGVGDPWRIAQFALVDPALSLAGIVVVVDTSTLDQRLADPLLADSLTRPLAHADLVLLNQIDRCEPAAVEAAELWVERCAPGVARLRTTHADLPWQLFAAHPRPTPRRRDEAGDPLAGWQSGRLSSPLDHGQRFETWSWSPPGRFDEAALRAWIKSLPGSVLRLKGWLPIGEGRVAELQFAGRHGSIRSRSVADDRGASLLAIGLRAFLPVEALETGLDACRIAAGD